MTGPARQLVLHSAFEALQGDDLCLLLAADSAELNVPALHDAIAESLRPVLGFKPRLQIRLGSQVGDTAHQRQQRERAARLAAADAAFRNLPEVQRLVREQGARILPDSIRPFDD